MSPTHLVSIGEIAQMLGDRARALCVDLLPQGVLEGNEWRVGGVAGEPGRSMAVRLSGARAGIWCDWAGRPEDRGDALDLVAQVLFRGDKARAIGWARAWLGLDRADPNSFAVQRRRVEQRRERERDESAGRRRFAQALFLQAQAQIAGSETERYLKGRRIDFAALGRQPRCLRHHVGLVDPVDGVIYPAMVAAITAPDGGFAGIHRTYLEAQADGRVGKAPIEDAKRTLGRYAGGCIRLWRGASGKPFAEAIAGEEVLIGEGIEDVATAVMGRPELRALVAVSLANMGAVVLPRAIGMVTILAQNDPALTSDGRPHPAREAFQRAIQNFQAQGKRVRIARPPARVKDINAYAMEEAG